MVLEPLVAQKGVELSAIFTEIAAKYVEIAPIVIVGLVAGFLSCIHNGKWTKKEFFKGVLLSCFLSMVTYGLLLAVDIPYLTRVSIAGLVGFLGFENSLDFIERVLTIIRTHKKQS